MVTEATATSLLHQLGAFSRSLDPDERELFAALLGPGIARAIGDAEVEPFGIEGHESDRLVQALAELARRAQSGGRDTGAGTAEPS